MKHYLHSQTESESEPSSKFGGGGGKFLRHLLTRKLCVYLVNRVRTNHMLTRSIDGHYAKQLDTYRHL